MAYVQRKTAEQNDIENANTINFAIPHHVFYSSLIETMRRLKGKPLLFDMDKPINENMNINFVFRDNCIVAKRNNVKAYLDEKYKDTYINEIVLIETKKIIHPKQTQLTDKMLEDLINGSTTPQQITQESTLKEE